MTLNASALSALEAAGLNEAGWARAQHPGDPTWHGDDCGCTDDRCIGFHHDPYAPCGCLQVLLERLGEDLTRTAESLWQASEAAGRLASRFQAAFQIVDEQYAECFDTDGNELDADATDVALADWVVAEAQWSAAELEQVALLHESDAVSAAAMAAFTGSYASERSAS